MLVAKDAQSSSWEVSAIMVTPITTVLCDLDGTLIDSRRDIALAFQHALRHLVEGTLPDEVTIAQHIGKPLEHMAREQIRRP